MNAWGLGSLSNVLLASLLCYAQGAIVPPPWADPNHNPCASQPGGWQLIYWPADKKCYRIFQRGYPCPETMELSPGLDKGTPECNCPPGSAQYSTDSLCYPIFQQGPCESNQYFAPEPDRPDRRRLGRCVAPEPCTQLNSVYHPRDKRCHSKFTKGPCPEGQLITSGGSSPLLGECRCDSTEMSEFYWEPGGTCHQHFTTGPCQERGGLFLPGGQCGCHPSMPHYHNATSRCYQLGGLGPCPGGHEFSMKDPSQKHAECLCKDGYVRWSGDGVCYRPYTRGPCDSGYMYSVNHTSSGMDIGCIPVPCSSGKLHFPGGKGCHRVGTQGPCPTGQLVLFQDSVKTSVEGISYLGMCGCARYTQDNTLFPTPFGSESPSGGVCGTSSDKTPAHTLSKEPREDICVNKRGMITWYDGTCKQLYAQGPCNAGEWVVPDRGKGQRLGRGWWKGKCECRPGYTVTIATSGDNENKTLCQAPTVVLAKFLNNKTNGYKYKNKQEFLEDGENNRVETFPSQSNKYTTKLTNVRNNSKVTKLSSLRSEEDRSKSPQRGSDRRNSRYKTNWETRELNRMKELQDENQKEEEAEDNGGERSEETGTPKTDETTPSNVRKEGTNPNDVGIKDTEQEKNEIIKKINAINISGSNKHHTGNSRELSVNRRINSKELKVDALSPNEQKLLESQESKNNRRGRKYNMASQNNSNGDTAKEKNKNQDDEVYRNLKTIQDDINEYIRQQQNHEEQEDRLKNHKIVNEDLKENKELNSKLDDEELSQSGTEEFDTNISLAVINEKSANLRKYDEESNRKTNQHKNEEFEEDNSTETLIMVEDKKGIKNLSEYDHRKHIKDYVKPIIIFE